MNINQRGKFSIAIMDIRQNLEAMARFMRGMVIVDTEFVFFNLTIKYTVVSSYFKEISEGESAPYYGVVQSDNGEFYLLDETGEKL